MATSDERVQAAIDLLPSDGGEVEFNAYKAQLQAADPDNWKEDFNRMLKYNLVKTVTRRPEKGVTTVHVKRQS